MLPFFCCIELLHFYIGKVHDIFMERITYNEYATKKILQKHLTLC